MTEPKSTLNLLDICEVRTPGQGGCKGGNIDFTLPHEKKNSRLVFIFKSPRKLSQQAALQFVIDYSEVKNLKYDIKTGDACFPEIQIQSSDGEVYRLKRGNFKDFFDLSAKGQAQTVDLSLSSFIYNVDWSTNTAPSEDFFAKEIQHIIFDFLRADQGDAKIRMTAPRIVDQDAPPPSVFGLFDIAALGPRKNQVPPFLTSGSNLCLEMTKTALGLATCPEGAVLVTRSLDPWTLHAKRWPIHDLATSIEIPLTKLGVTDFECKLVSKGKILAQSTFSAVKSLERNENSSSKMGLSDGANFDRVGQQGGEFLRFVLSLDQIQRVNGEYRLNPAVVPIDVMKSVNAKWIVAFKAMPKHLHKDLRHGYRHGPNSIVEYEALMNWLIPELRSIGVVYFEAWNEANVIHEWAGSFEDLVEMQRAVFEAVTQTDDVGCVLTPSSTTWDYEYLERVLSSDIPKYAHAIALHGYTYSPHEAHSLFEKVEQAIQNCSYPDMDVFLTEIGFRTPAFSLQDQAAFFALFTLHTFFRDRFKCIAWFRFQNSRPEKLDSYDQNASAGYALVGYQGMYCRPALATYHFFDHLLSKLTPIDILDEDSFTIFTAKHEEVVVRFVYSKRQENVHTMLDMSKYLYDIFGNKITKLDAEFETICVESSHNIATVLDAL